MHLLDSVLLEVTIQYIQTLIISDAASDITTMHTCVLPVPAQTVG